MESEGTTDEESLRRKWQSLSLSQSRSRSRSQSQSQSQSQTQSLQHFSPRNKKLFQKPAKYALEPPSTSIRIPISASDSASDSTSDSTSGSISESFSEGNMSSSASYMETSFDSITSLSSESDHVDGVTEESSVEDEGQEKRNLSLIAPTPSSLFQSENCSNTDTHIASSTHEEVGKGENNLNTNTMNNDTDASSTRIALHTQYCLATSEIPLYQTVRWEK